MIYESRIAKKGAHHLRDEQIVLGGHAVCGGGMWGLGRMVLVADFLGGD